MTTAEAVRVMRDAAGRLGNGGLDEASVLFVAEYDRLRAIEERAQSQTKHHSLAHWVLTGEQV
jgi:hypothetical protein